MAVFQQLFEFDDKLYDGYQVNDTKPMTKDGHQDGRTGNYGQLEVAGRDVYASRILSCYLKPWLILKFEGRFMIERDQPTANE